VALKQMSHKPKSQHLRLNEATIIVQK